MLKMGTLTLGMFCVFLDWLLYGFFKGAHGLEGSVVGMSCVLGLQDSEFMGFPSGSGVLGFCNPTLEIA